MDPKTVTEVLTAEWSAFLGAPIIFLGALIVMGALMWVVLKAFKAQEIKVLRERLEQARDNSTVIKQFMPEISDYLRAQSAPKDIQAKAAEVQSANNAVANVTLEPAKSTGRITTGPAPPINWDDHFGISYTGGGASPLLVQEYAINGKVTASHEVQLQDAYLASDQTNARLPLTIATSVGRLRPDQINPLPPETVVTLCASFDPALSPDQLLDQWGPMTLYAVCDGVTFQKKFSLAVVQAPIGAFRPAQFGPRPTKK